MGWIKYNDSEKYKILKAGTICLDTDGDFLLVGDINTSEGTNDEFTVDIEYYNNDFVDEISEMLEKAKKQFKK
jgi:hypothetical protein